MRQAQSLWEIQREIRAAIRERIHRREISQSALSRETGISQGQISSLLSGRKTPTIADLDTLAEAAGLRIAAPIEGPQLAQAARPEETERTEAQRAIVIQPRKPHPWRKAA